MYEQQKKEEEIKGGFTMKLVSKMRKKKNNKGFSLVELIVVVLIIAIIAVALAPQVMKWVGTARDNTDKNNSAVIKSATLTAYAEYLSKGHSLGTAKSIKVTSNELAGKTVNDIEYYIDEILNGEYPIPNAGGNFEIKITTDGKVTVTP